MQDSNCQIVLVGHTSHKLILSIDKEVSHKLIFITESEPLPGTLEAKKVLADLLKYYKERRIEVEDVKFDFHVQTKPVAELVHLIYQQRLLNYNNIIVNISGGLRYMDIWFYLASSMTNSRIIHGDFIYEKNEEVGIYSNVELLAIPFQSLTEKQFEFLELFFDEYEDPKQFFSSKLFFNENPVLRTRKKYQSLEELKNAMQKVRNETISRGAINGFVQKLSTISAINVYPNPEDKKEKSIEISYFGIAYFLYSLFQKYFVNNQKL
jgi:hypothetical protein